MHNTGKINFKMHGKYFIFCIAESMALQGHGDEVSTAESSFEVEPVPEKVESFTAFDTLDSDDDLSMTPPPSSTPVTPFNVKQKTKPLPTPLPAGTQTKPEPKKKKATQQDVLEMQLEVLNMQKEMLLLKNEKLKIQVALLKEQTNGCTLMSSIENL